MFETKFSGKDKVWEGTTPECSARVYGPAAL